VAVEATIITVATSPMADMEVEEVVEVKVATFTITIILTPPLHTVNTK
jgi:hypothetical protein